jgi:hypothetical protein
MSVILDAKDFPQWKQDDIKDAAALMEPASEDLLVKRGGVEVNEQFKNG